MYTQTITPRFNETDAFGHINNNVYSVWFDACREPINRLYAPTLDYKQMKLIAAHVSCDFLREVHYGSEVVIKTAFESIGNSSMHISHALYQKGKLCTVGKAVIIHFDHEIKQSIRIPDYIREELEKHKIDHRWEEDLV